MNNTGQTPALTQAWQPTPQEVDAAVLAVQDAFRHVRQLILDNAGQVGYTDKQDGSPVTDTDVAVEQAIQAELARQFPAMPVFGEESGYDTDLPDNFWLVDPIDGTASFIKSIPTFTSMAVLIQAGEATASVIYNPTTDEMYVAQQGKGTYKNGIRLNLAAVPVPSTAFCKDQFISELSGMLRPLGVSCKQEPSSGGGYGFTMVLDGNSAARFNMHSGGYTHDYAPGALLVREAGGAIIPIKEDNYTYESRSFVAAHPALAEVIQAHVPRLRELENAA